MYGCIPISAGQVESWKRDLATQGAQLAAARCRIPVPEICWWKPIDSDHYCGATLEHELGHMINLCDCSHNDAEELPLTIAEEVRHCWQFLTSRYIGWGQEIQAEEDADRFVYRLYGRSSRNKLDSWKYKKWSR